MRRSGDQEPEPLETLGAASGLPQDSAGPTCPVCLGVPNPPVDTNCGHSFCAQCILTHWRHDRHPLPCRCPICRRDVTLLLSRFDCSSENSSLYAQITNYNHQMRDIQGGVISRLRDAPTLLQHLRRDTFRLRGGLPICSKLYFVLLGLALLLYFVSPIDLIPEGIFGIVGLVDDLFFFVCGLIYASNAYRIYISNLGQ